VCHHTKGRERSEERGIAYLEAHIVDEEQREKIQSSRKKLRTKYNFVVGKIVY
jgi:hypothetical protein